MNLYLDYDGVLHPDSVFRYRGAPTLMHQGNTRGDERLLEWAPVLEAILEPYPHVKIVLSTSWVPMLGFTRAKAYLPPALQARVIGSTWHNRFPEWHGVTKNDWVQIARFAQVLMHVNRNTPRRWLAIDNDDDGWKDSHRQHLVHTDDWKGLGDPEAQNDLRQKLSDAFQLDRTPSCKP